MEPPAPATRGVRRRKPWRRRALWLLLACLILLTALGIAAYRSLQYVEVRKDFIERASAYLEREYGVRLTAEQVRFGFPAGWIELIGVRLSAPGSPPFLIADRVIAGVEPRSFFRDVIVVRSLEIEAPRIDLTAPPPVFRTKPAEPGAKTRRIDVHDLLLTRGEIAPAPSDPALAQWLESWDAKAVTVRGSYVGERADLAATVGELRVKQPDLEPQLFQLASRVAGRLDQPLAVRDLRLTGAGLTATAEGTAAVAGLAAVAKTQIDARFVVDAEPGVLVPRLLPGGKVHAAGNISLPANSGRLALKAEGLPAEALRPYLEPDQFSDLSLAGTVFDTTGDWTWRAGAPERATGPAEMVWRRGSRTLAHLNVRAVPSAEGTLRAELEGDLLPGSPGRRHVRGALTAPSWAEAAQAGNEGTTAEIRLPDVGAALAEIRALWPKLVPALPADLPARGALTADLRLSGPFASPDAKLQASWIPEPGSRVRLDARGKLPSGEGTARAEVSSLPLSMLAPGITGAVSGTVDLAGSRRGYRTRMALDASGIDGPARLETAHADADGVLSIEPLVYRGTLALAGAGLVASPNASSTARIARFQLTADGPLDLAQLAYTGPLQLEATDLVLEGSSSARLDSIRLDSIRLEADGRLAAEPAAYRGRLGLEGDGLASGADRIERFRLTADGAFSSDLGASSGEAALDATNVVLAALDAPIDEAHLEARLRDGEVWLPTLSAFSEARAVFGSAHFTVEPLLREADLDLQISRPLPQVRMAQASARLRQGTLTVEVPRFESDAGTATLLANVPLDALRQFPDLREALSGLPLEYARGPVSVAFTAPEVDSTTVLAALCLPPRPERLRAGVELAFTADPQALASGQGEIRLSGLDIANESSRVTADDDVVLRLADGRLEAPPVRLSVEGPGLEGAGVSLQGQADLARAWQPGDRWQDLVTRLSFLGDGTIDASLLNPFLEGGVAQGPVTLHFNAAGTPAALEAGLRLDGKDASFFWPGSFATRLEKPEVSVSLRDGKAVIESGRALLNGGTVDLTGGWDPEAGTQVEARLRQVRYVLPDLYSLAASLSGRLELRAPAEGRWRLGGELTVDRGVVDRDINLDREVLSFVRSPEDTSGAEASLLSEIDLSLSVATLDGVRVRNNVGDLLLSWQPLTVRGTLAEPRVFGRIDLAPGGLLFVYGQTVRIDRGSLSFRGSLEPEPDFATTSSIADASIGRLRGSSPLDQLERTQFDADLEERAERQLDLQESLAQGLAGYYGERATSRLGDRLRLSVRPVLEFQETDPTARLTVSRALSRNAAFALSLDLRNAESQTYLLDLHDFQGFPSLTLQAFTKDDDRYGGSLQQTLELSGGQPPRDENEPRRRRLTVHAPQGVSKRALRRAVRIEKGDPVPSSAPFDLEVILAQDLRRRGYPDARVTVTAQPVGSRPGWVDLAVTVEPGPRATFVFEGDRPPRATRVSITSLYRADFYEKSSIEEMRKEAVLVFRALGHLDPQVEIEVRPDDPVDPVDPPHPASTRQVAIRTAAGRKVKLERIDFEGIDPESAARLRQSFPRTLSRVELAMAVPGADQRLRNALRELGFASGGIAGRELSPEGSRLTVRLEPGPRQALGTLTIQGVEGEERERLLALLPIHAGDPARDDQIGLAVRRLRRDFLDRGYRDVEIRAVRPPNPDRPLEVPIVFEIAPGRPYRLAEVQFEGQRWTRPVVLERTAALAEGVPLRQEDLDQAQERLFRTGLFSRVVPEVENLGDGSRVSFSLLEKPRFRVAYGVRWENTESASAVVDFVDQNFLGRALTLGLRTLYETEDQSARLFLGTGGLFGSRIALETYSEVRRITEDGLIEDRSESALQVSRPFGSGTVSRTGRLYLRRRTTHIREEEPDPFLPLDLRIENTYLGVQAIYDSRDDLIDARRGIFASLDLSGSGEYLGSDFEYARLFGQLNLYRRAVRFKGRDLTWAQSTRVGLARGFKGQELLRDVRFFAGGELSVRGYETESLGPEESLGDVTRPLGGEALLVINEELRFPVWQELAGLVFFDLGQVWADTSDFGSDLAKSVGFGLRARTPIGLIRGDMAFPLDRREGDASYRFYIGFGNAF